MFANPILGFIPCIYGDKLACTFRSPCLVSSTCLTKKSLVHSRSGYTIFFSDCLRSSRSVAFKFAAIEKSNVCVVEGVRGARETKKYTRPAFIKTYPLKINEGAHEGILCVCERKKVRKIR